MNTFLKGIMPSVGTSRFLLRIVTPLVIATVTFVAQASDWENGAVIASFLNNARGERDAMRLVLAHCMQPDKTLTGQHSSRTVR
jgi:hypothetical protein